MVRLTILLSERKCRCDDASCATVPVAPSVVMLTTTKVVSPKKVLPPKSESASNFVQSSLLFAFKHVSMLVAIALFDNFEPKPSSIAKVGVFVSVVVVVVVVADAVIEVPLLVSTLIVVVADILSASKILNEATPVPSRFVLVK